MDIWLTAKQFDPEAWVELPILQVGMIALVVGKIERILDMNECLPYTW